MLEFHLVENKKKCPLAKQKFYFILTFNDWKYIFGSVCTGLSEFSPQAQLKQQFSLFFCMENAISDLTFLYINICVTHTNIMTIILKHFL